MSRQGWVETLMTAEGDGTALTGTTTPTSILPSGARCQLPGGWADTGRILRITATGRISSIVTTPGTFAFTWMLGTTTPSAQTVACALGAVQLNALVQSNESWWLDTQLTVRAIGSGTAANAIATGLFVSQAIVGGGTGVAGAANLSTGAGVSSYSQTLPQTAPAVGTGFDSTFFNVVDLFGTWSLANANTITVHQYALMALN